MNYRHIYHAGNFADVLKHLVLVACLGRLQAKDAPMVVLDAHAGAGLYDLSSEEALKTGEAERGVLRLAGGAEPVLRDYLGAVALDLAAGRYPGSPLIAARMLRPHHRLIANELHASTADELAANLDAPNARVTRMDAYECIRAHLPPKEKRGLVLIDPPFEKKDEFETLMRQMTEWKKRWATGIYLLWHPIKAHLPVDALSDAARDLGLPRTWRAEAMAAPLDAPGLAGCGVILFNAPFTVPEQVAAALPELAEQMQLHSFKAEWIVPDKA
jgi:23S rRNA (adenine2030-N6)-methyltransferase